MADEFYRVTLQLQATLQFCEELLSKPLEERYEADILEILPWIRHQSSLFKNLEDDELIYVLKHVRYVRFKKDHLVVKQGDRGNCFFVIIKGAVSIYAKKEDELQSDYLPHHETGAVRNLKERLAYFGTELGSLRSGSSFGEMVLTSSKKERNATVIADEPTGLIAIDEDLYKQSFYVYHMEWRAKCRFVQGCPLFAAWPTSLKDLLIESLKMHKIQFGNRVVEQRSLCNSVFFIAKGAARILNDPRKCKEQYEAMAPRANMKKESFPIEDEEKITINDIEDLVQPLTVIQKRRRRLEHGFVAMENRLRQREIEVTTAGLNDVIGDVEMVLDLPEYCASAECVEALEVYELDKASFHRLIARRNPDTLEVLLKVVRTKLTRRVERFGEIPLYRLLLDRATAIPQKAKAKVMMKRKRQTLARIKPIGSQRPSKTFGGGSLIRRQTLLTDDGKQRLESKGEIAPKETNERTGKDRRGSERKETRALDATKKQYTLDEFRELKKKMQARGKLIGRVSG